MQLEHLQSWSELGHDVDFSGPEVHAADEQSQVVAEGQAFPTLVEESAAGLDIARLNGPHRFECASLELENMCSVRGRALREDRDGVPVSTFLARVLPLHDALNL